MSVIERFHCNIHTTLSVCVIHYIGGGTGEGERGGMPPPPTHHKGGTKNVYVEYYCMDTIALLFMSSAPWPLAPHLPNHSSAYALCVRISSLTVSCITIMYYIHYIESHPHIKTTCPIG